MYQLRSYDELVHFSADPAHPDRGLILECQKESCRVQRVQEVVFAEGRKVTMEGKFKVVRHGHVRNVKSFNMKDINIYKTMFDKGKIKYSGFLGGHAVLLLQVVCWLVLQISPASDV